MSPARKAVVVVILLATVALLQAESDATRVSLNASLPGAFTPEMIRLADLGFHPGVASFLWANALPEFLDLFFRGHQEYFADLAFLNAVDPKMTYPYAFSVLTLPLVPTSSDPDGLAQSFTIGAKGLASGEPDWRIPYYMAINYYLTKKDLKDAASYFNLAASTPGVPDYAESFALNFGVNQRDRDRVRNLWITIYESSNDPGAKERAAAYVVRLNELDYLDNALSAYKKQYGAYPSSLGMLVARGIIPGIPTDPFGFSFEIRSGGAAGIDTTHPPKYLTGPQGVPPPGE